MTNDSVRKIKTSLNRRAKFRISRIFSTCLRLSNVVEPEVKLVEAQKLGFKDTSSRRKRSLNASASPTVAVNLMLPYAHGHLLSARDCLCI